MTLDDLEQVGIVVGEIADAALGNQFIACVGKVTRGGYQIRRRATLDGRHTPASGNALLQRVGRAEVGRSEPVGDTRGRDGLELGPSPSDAARRHAVR